MQPKRPKPRGLAGPPGWLEESDQADVILYVMDGPYLLPFPYCTGCLDWKCPLPSADGISSCCDVVNVHNHPRTRTKNSKFHNFDGLGLKIAVLYFLPLLLTAMKFFF
jgi:hypothetical protein